MQREHLQQQAAAPRKNAAPSVFFSKHCASFVWLLWALRAFQSLKFLNFSEKLWRRHRRSFHRAVDCCLVSLFQQVVDWSGLEDEGKAHVGRHRVPASETIITERWKPVCVFVFAHVMLPHPVCLFPTAVNASLPALLCQKKNTMWTLTLILSFK